MKWACCMIFCALLLASSVSSPFADAGRSAPSSSQTLPLSGSEVKISPAIFGWSRVVANRKWQPEMTNPVGKLLQMSRVVEQEEEAGDKHPVDKLLRRQKADMTESYILGGY